MGTIRDNWEKAEQSRLLKELEVNKHLQRKQTVETLRSLIAPLDDELVKAAQEHGRGGRFEYPRGWDTGKRFPIINLDRLADAIKCLRRVDV